METAGMIILPTFKEAQELWPQGYPCTHELYVRAITIMEERKLSLNEAVEVIREEDREPAIH